MQLSLKKYVLALKHTFSISRESHDYQDTLITSLSLDGQTGYGESTSNPYYKITVESMKAEIEGIRPEIEAFELYIGQLRYWHTITRIKNIRNSPPMATGF